MAVPVLLAGTPICGAILYRAHRGWGKWQIAARGLLFGICSLCAVGAAELTVAWLCPRNQAALGTANTDPDLPERFAEPSPDNGLTIAVVGESSAFGIPFKHRLSVGKIVAWQLHEAISGREFGLEMVAEPGDTSRGQYARLARVRRRPDAIIVYCGHNELIDGIPWTHRVVHYLDERPSLLRRIDELAGRLSPVCELIRETADRYRAAVMPAEGMHNPLVDSPAYSPEQYTARLTAFRRRLEAITSYCERIRAIAILVVPPANDAGFDPSRSFMPERTTRPEREAFARSSLAAREVEKSNPAQAIELYRSILASQPGFAETHYRLGRLLERVGAWDEAYAHFVKAQGSRRLADTPARRRSRSVITRWLRTMIACSWTVRLCSTQ